MCVLMVASPRPPLKAKNFTKHPWNSAEGVGLRNWSHEVASHPTWVLEPELRSPRRAASALNCQAISRTRSVETAWNSVSTGSKSPDSTNHGLKILF